MYAVIVSVIILVALLLILVVLAQNPKGGGLSSQFGGAGTQQIMGVKKTGDILEKLTWGFAIGLLVLTMSTNFVIEENAPTITSPNLENAQESILPQAIPTESGDAIDDLGLEEEISSDSTN
ncbi:MAG: preprotein translocase subunit SecG [Flammeovirgaceae bacterium]|nr:preprotein translocase subunit SecG [Flammeovirgaceae bacterium]MBE63683.1 preprotein translocase subunit SecG [Flammeovirgaceae bacterium]MBR07001.1 preprotein translocase subunit SecG [Rickettsiales bacterium]